jgi:hypothetical protein
LSLKLAIGFSFYNSAKEIPRALDPWYDHVDYIIAIDGRYWTPQTPDMIKKGLSKYSGDKSEQVLKERYSDKLIYEKLFDTQMNKRQRYMDLAGENDVDFLITIDSDDLIYQSPNWDRFHKQLNALYEAWPDQQVFDMMAWIPDRKSWQPQHNEVKPNSWVPYTRIHKNPADTYYCLNHWSWAFKKHSREEIYKYVFDNPAINPLDPESNKYLLKSRMMVDAVKITTDRVLRTQDQLTFGDEWAWQNMHWENFYYLVEAFAHSTGGKFVYEQLKEQYPNIQYYFDEGGRLVPFHEEKGEYIIHKPVAEIPVKT